MEAENAENPTEKGLEGVLEKSSFSEKKSSFSPEELQERPQTQTFYKLERKGDLYMEDEYAPGMAKKERMKMLSFLIQHPLSAPSGTPRFLMDSLILLNRWDVHEWSDRPISLDSKKVKGFFKDLKNHPKTAERLSIDLTAEPEKQLKQLYHKLGHELERYSSDFFITKETMI